MKLLAIYIFGISLACVVSALALLRLIGLYHEWLEERGELRVEEATRQKYAARTKEIQDLNKLLVMSDHPSVQAKLARDRGGDVA